MRSPAAEPGVRRWEAVGLLGLSASYLTFQFRALLRPGLYSDEALDGIVAQRILRAGWAHFRAWPTGLNYHAALQSYLLLPFLAAIHPAAAALRSAEVFAGLIVLWTAWACAREYFGRLAAILAVGLLVANPGFMFLSRISVPHAGIMAGAALAVLVCVSRWLREGRDRWLFAACLLCGAGLSLRLWFAWFIAGLAVGLAAAASAAARRWRRPRALRRTILAALCLAAGLAPMILKELTGSATETFGAIAQNLPVTRCCNIDNLAVERNLEESLGHFDALLAGRLEDCFPPYAPRPSGRLERAFERAQLLLLAAAGMLILALKSGENPPLGVLAVLTFFATLGCSVFTISDLRQDHLYLLLPLAEVLLGAAASFAVQRAATGRLRGLWALALLPVALSASFQAVRTFRLERFLDRTGGVASFSDASFSLAHWLEAGGISAPKFCDWGLHDTILFLSAGRVQPLACWRMPPGSGTDSFAAFRRRCLGGENVYVFIDPARSPNFQSLSTELAARGRRLIERKQFLTRDGRTAFGVYSLR